jgi:hypothetical protein
MDALRRSSRISRKDKIRNTTIRQQIGVEESIIKEIEQKQLTWYGHVQRMAEERLPRIVLRWIPKQKRARGRPNKNWMEGIRKAMTERTLQEGQWDDRKQWIQAFEDGPDRGFRNIGQYKPDTGDTPKSGNS